MITHRHLPLSVAASLALVFLGCTFDSPCDPGQVEVHALCEPAPVSLDASDNDAEDSDAGDTDATTDPFECFGVACTAQSECASYGLRCGEAALPYCLQINCMGTPNTCPPTWTCLDTRGVSPDPNVTSVCLKP